MSSFVARYKNSKRYLEGFHAGNMSNFISIKSSGWINFSSLDDASEYFYYMYQTLLGIKRDDEDKKVAAQKDINNLSKFEILEIKDKKIINIFEPTYL